MDIDHNSKQENSSVLFRIQEQSVFIPKSSLAFNRWKGIPLKERFGNKPLIDVNGKPMFAELAIMHEFLKNGFEARWIETYGKGNMNPIFLTEWKDESYKNQTHVPIENSKILEMLNGIAKENKNSFSGCWDVIAWKNDQLIFAESKHKGKDRIRQTQIDWLAAAFRYGLKPENFLVIEWTF